MIKEYEQIWNKLATSRALSRWRKTDLGRKGNWRAVVANRRQERVLWLHDYLTELAVCLIYSVQERWPPILDWRASGRRGRGALAHTIGGIYCGSSPAITGYR
jgi:hypothetical protein